MNFPERYEKEEIQFRRSVSGSKLRVSLHRTEIQSLFDQLIHRPWGLSAWCPPADVVERGDQYEVNIDLPGVTDNEIRVEAGQNRITVQGTRQPAEPQAELRTHVAERSWGAFERVFDFEDDLDVESLIKNLDKGVLRIVVKKVKG